MRELTIYIPETWRGEDDACPWVLAVRGGAPTARGENRFADMPKVDETILVAPASYVLLTEAKLPKGNRKQLRQALPFAVEDKITADPETIHVAMGAPRADGVTPLAVIEKQWLKRVLTALAETRIEPRRMEVETLVPPVEPDTWTVVWRGREGFVRTGAASGLALAGNQSPPLELRLALRERNAPREIVVRPEKELPDLAHWSSELGLPVVAGRHWDISEARNEALDLLQGEFAQGNGGMAKLKPVFILAAAIVALQFALTIYDWAALRMEAKRLTAAIEKTFRDTFPETKTIVDAPLQMERNVAALRRSSGQVDKGDFFPLLAAASRSLKTAGSLRAIQYENEKLKVDVGLPESQAAEELLRVMQQSGIRASLESVNSRGDSVEARYLISPL